MSNSTLYKTIYNFLLESPPAHITAFSVIYQVIEDDMWHLKDDLRPAVHQAVTELKGGYDKNSEKYQKLDEIFLKFDDAYEGVCSLRNIRKSKQEDELTPNEIETNLRSLKTNLASSEAPYAQHFRKYLKKKKNTSNLSWEVPLASQVICADSEMVKLLEEKDVEAYNFFMDPAERMKVATPPVIKNKCDEFVINFMDSITDIPDNRFSHDKSWKESDENLAKITTDILEILRDVWKNPAFGQKLAKSQSEGTYMTDVIVPLIRASLKDLPIGKSGYISTAERQSMASKDRRGVGKRPDLMFIASCNNRTYELIFAESSRIVCDKQKKNDDEVKLWREMNDGMYWAHKGCKSDKDNFGIIGIQVRGTEMRLNTLVRGVDEIDRLYNLFTVEIPIQPTDEDIVFRFVEALLTLRNILHVNISLLFYASPVSSSSNSSTVSSPRREGEQIRTRKVSDVNPPLHEGRSLKKKNSAMF